MGLDMRLKAQRYCGHWDHSDGAEKARYMAIAKACGLNGVQCVDAPSLTVSVTVAYWRKANAIHNWFVQNCQAGVDECQEADVSWEQLASLRDLCNHALETRDTSLLPSRGGFFFGSTDYDDGYWMDIKETAEKLTALLADERFCDGDWQFTYRSSW
jgi:hypothetical protein